MARANLHLDERVSESFTQAQETRSIRFLKIRIEDENMLLENVVDKVGTVQSDFDTILMSSLNDTEAAMIVYCMTDDIAPSVGLSWILITWIPDGCRVRDKMLYSSSREDLKRKIGLGFFKGEYAANYRDDLTWMKYQESLNREISADLLTENERLLLEEKVRTL